MTAVQFIVCLLLLAAVNVSAKKGRKSAESKLDLCSKFVTKCEKEDVPLLGKIIFLTINEATRLKGGVAAAEFKKKTLQNEKQILQHRVNHPSQPDLVLPPASGGTSGVGLFHFQYKAQHGNLSCISLNECLTTLHRMRESLDGLEEMKHEYTTKIKQLENEHDALNRSIENLKQQLRARG